MRRFLQLATIFLVAVVAAGSPLATVSAPHAIPAVAAAPQVVAPQCAAVTSIVSTPSSLICVLPHCDGPYCRASNGCWVCCTH